MRSVNFKLLETKISPEKSGKFKLTLKFLAFNEHQEVEVISEDKSFCEIPHTNEEILEHIGGRRACLQKLTV